MKKTFAIAIAAASLLAAAQPASAAPRTAYFKVGLVASQDVSWKKQLTYRTNCGSGFVQLDGHGESALRIRTPRAQPAVAQLRRNGRVTLRFRGSGALLPVVGSLTRQGVSHATSQTPEATTGCPKPEPPVASDCATRRFGGHSTIGVTYLTPERSPERSPDRTPHPDLDLAPLTDPDSDFNLGPLKDAIVLTAHRYRAGAGWCTNGARAPAATTCCAVPSTSPWARTAPRGRLPSSWLFGKRSRFTVNEHSSDTVDTAPRLGAVSGSFPITTKTDWTLTFRRLSHRPSGL